MTCVNDEGIAQLIKGILIPIFVWKILVWELKRSAKSGNKLFVIKVEQNSQHIENSKLDELHVIPELKYLFVEEIPWLLQLMDIYFTIDIVLGATRMSKVSYWISISKLFDLKM